MDYNILKIKLKKDNYIHIITYLVKSKYFNITKLYCINNGVPPQFPAYIGIYKKIIFVYYTDIILDTV